MEESFEDLVGQVRRRIEMERRFGLTFDVGGGGSAGSAGAAGREGGEATPASREAGSKAERLAELQRRISNCQACPLGRTRTNLVFGVGNPEAELVFVGEAPGEDEDRQGIPFVGRAGQLLTRIIVNGMKLRREDVYICNVLKCRPPGNRNPSAAEIFHCLPYLEEQLEIIRPKVICALGAIAAQALLNTDDPIGRLRGRWHRWRGIPMMVTYHPAYLLRTPAAKAKVWSDIKQVMAELGLSP